ncbi:MarR family winged helix-turn-helix transcriptional regulator [Nocardioides perillae]|uniref:DNA-binding MarR family transcriptional regulator n=1 Tax=Nocardioides perillae TaxID=1119534 RepID=A0A7Y9RXI8_9ACTN|nr:MarR family transcriptional regulator [Nocardioides perillae]NYG56537.1 DNA-binding MarR family transcriptional regulator [Nocardioides perillae]
MTEGGTTRWLEERQQHAWRALLVGTTLLYDRLDQDLRRGFDLSLGEYEILVRLSEAPGRALRMAHLADSLRHSRSRVTHTVGRMEAAGLVQRSRCGDDGRGILATLTDEGFGLLERAAPLHVAGVRAGLVDLVSDEDLAAMGRVMDAVADRLVGGHPGADIR